jgi:hypothetical protein
MTLRETWGGGCKQFRKWEIDFRRCVDEVFLLLGFTCRKLKLFIDVSGLPVCLSSGVSVLFPFILVATEHIVVPKRLFFLPNFSFPSYVRRLPLPVHLSTSLVLALVFHLSVIFFLMLQPDWLFFTFSENQSKLS